jgi:hypothetical protein
MRRIFAVVLLAVLAACKDQGPKGLDPIVLASNQQNRPLVITWYDQSGQVQRTDVHPFTTECIHFVTTTLADSVRYEIVAGDTTTTYWQRMWSPWFDPITGTTSDPEYPTGFAEFWTVTLSGDQNGPTMLTVPDPPCE